MSFESLLNRQGTQERYTETQNSFGENEKAWSVIDAALKCRVQKTNINQKHIELVKGGMGSYILAEYTIFALPSKEFIDDDRITVDGVKYKVLKAQKDSSLHHWELKCEITN